MSNKFSLSILQRDPDFAKLFQQKIETVREDKKNLLDAASKYNSKFQKKIDEGTEKLKRLLQEGKASGLTEDEVRGKLEVFVPSKSTPILNFLYFLTNECEELDETLRLLNEQRMREDSEYGHLTHDKNHDYGTENTEDMVSYIYNNVNLETFNKLKKLKSLANSDNEEEATLAMKKCRELCKKYNLEYSKIPTN
jgi:hypothetical protein